MRWRVDLGEDEDQERIAAHLAERGISLDDVLCVAEAAAGRRKGDRLFAYGRGCGGRPLVVVFERSSLGFRPRTGWPMDDRELRWWRRHSEGRR